MTGLMILLYVCIALAVTLYLARDAYWTREDGVIAKDNAFTCMALGILWPLSIPLILLAMLCTLLVKVVVWGSRRTDI